MGDGVRGVVFRAGDLDWHVTNDWLKEWTYATAWQEALRHGRLPWFLADSFQTTNRLLANPETVASPHVIALRWLSPGTFLVLNAAICAGVGVVALSRLCQALTLSPLISFAVFAVFLLNGHIVSHLSAGHLQWITCWLLPCLFLFLFRAGTGDRTARTETGLALSLMAMTMLGGWHVFVWSVIFVTAWALADRSRWMFALRVALWTGSLTAFRIAPAAAVYASSANIFLGGYPSVGVLVGALVGEPRDAINGLSWWEYDAFVGWVGFALVCAGAGAIDRARRASAEHQWWLPSVVLLALSSSDLYKWTLFRLPGFVSERVSTRLVLLTVLGFTLIGSAILNRWAAQPSGRLWRTASVGAAGALMLPLLFRANLFRPAPAQVPAALPASVLAMQPVGLSYSVSVGIGAAISLFALALALRHQRARPTLANC